MWKKGCVGIFLGMGLLFWGVGGCGNPKANTNSTTETSTQEGVSPDGVSKEGILQDSTSQEAPQQETSTQTDGGTNND